MTTPPEPGKILYHYTTTARAIEIVRDRTLWATSIHHMNDAREFRHALALVRRRTTEVQDGADPDETALLTALETRLQGISQHRVCAFCLTENGDQLSQWRAYCRGGGYSLGFAQDGLARAMAQHGFRLVPCVYEDAEQRRIVRELLVTALTSFRASLGALQNRDAAIKASLDAFFTTFVYTGPLLKDPAFKEESEWRLVVPGVRSDDPRLAFRAGPGFPVPHLVCLLETLPLIRLVVGPTPEPELAMSTTSALLHRYGVKDWSVSRSSIPYRGL